MAHRTYRIEYSTFEMNKAKMDIIFKIGYEAARTSFEKLNL
jgi:NTE family protein